jgi:hypothetical protein
MTGEVRLGPLLKSAVITLGASAPLKQASAKSTDIAWGTTKVCPTWPNPRIKDPAGSAWLFASFK